MQKVGSGAEVRGYPTRHVNQKIIIARYMFSNKKSYLCIMPKKTTHFDYETLVRYPLPHGLLDTFEVPNVDAECTGLYDETNTDIRILHIYLDDRALRDDVWHDLQPNRFPEPRAFNDFPVREHKVARHVRRRRWLTEDGKNQLLDTPALIADGTSYSIEVAAFLKEMVGYLPSDGPMRGAILPD